MNEEERQAAIEKGARRLVKNFKRMDAAGQLAYMEKLLGMLDDQHLFFLDFSVDMTPNQPLPGPPQYTMQAAMALSPSNKAMTELSNGDAFIIQEHAHQQYRMWVVPPGNIPIWSGELEEQEIDEIPTKYQVDPGRRIWDAMGVAPDHSSQDQALETAIQLLSANITNMRTELLVIKAEVVKTSDQEGE